MRTLLPLLLACSFLFALVGKTEAQYPGPVGPGDQIRVTTWDGRSLQGTLVTSSDSLISIRETTMDSSVMIPIASVSSLEVHFGQKRNTVKGLYLGALAGAAAGGLMGLASGGSPDDCWMLCYSAGEMAAIGAVAFGTLGGLAGMAVGSFMKTDRWENASPWRLKGSLQLAGGNGVGLSFSIPTEW